VGVFAGVYLHQDHPQARGQVLGLAARAEEVPEEAQHLAVILRDWLRPGPEEPGAEEQEPVRDRAWKLFQCLVTSTLVAVRGLNDRIQAAPDPETKRQVGQEGEPLLQLADTLGYQLYFASGAFDNKKASNEEHEAPESEGPSTNQKRTFYHRMVPLLDELTELAGFGFARLAHQLIETLEFLLEVDAAGVFLRIADMVRTARAANYQYESLGMDLIVRIVEQVMASHREVLLENPECRGALVEILDLFVSAGWPSARRLAYRLEEIYR
jgi:hypothetical protein